jgi:hypothetical protein
VLDFLIVDFEGQQRFFQGQKNFFLGCKHDFKKRITRIKIMKIGLMGVCSNYNKHKNNQVYKISKPR